MKCFSSAEAIYKKAFVGASKCDTVHTLHDRTEQ